MSKYILILTFISFLLTPSNVFAQKTAQQQTLRITPIFINMQLTPGSTSTYEVKIDNLLSVPLGIKANIESIDATNEENGISFDTPKQNEPFVSWITFSEKDFIIPENQSKTIRIDVKTPENAKDGGYYAVTFFTPIVSKPLEKKYPTVVSRVGSVILASIGTPKPIRPDKKAEVAEFKFDKKYQDSPSQMILRVKNAYSFHFSVKAAVEITSLFGNKKMIELEDKRILPGKIRKWTKTVDLPIGIYKANAAVSLGGGDQIFAKTYFIIFPVSTYAPFILGALALTILVFGRRRILKAIKVLVKDGK